MTDLSRRRELGRAALAMAGLALVLFVDVLLRGGRVASSGIGDAFNYFVPIREFGFGELARGNLALWNPYLFSGTPLLGGFQSALLYPLNAIYLLLPLDQAIDVDLMLHTFLAGLFTYAWVRGRGLRPLAAAFSACVLVCGAAFLLRVQAGQLTLVATMAWAPLLLLAVDRLLEGPSLGWTLVGVFAASIQVLAGYPACVYATGFTVGLYVLLRLRACPRPGPTLAALAVVGISPLLLGAAQLWPGLDTAGETVRAGGVPFSFATSFSLPPENLLTLLSPTFFGDVTFYPYWGRWYYWDATCYFGVIGLLLAVHGAVLGDREQSRGAGWIVLVLGVLALGRYTPVYHVVLALVPGFDAFRAPSKFLYQASLFVALFAGMGAERLLADARGSRRLAGLAAGLAAALAAGGVWVRATAYATGGPTFGRLLEAMYRSPERSFHWVSVTGIWDELGTFAVPLASYSLWGPALLLAVAAGLLAWRPRSPRAGHVLLVLAALELAVFAKTHRDSFPISQVRIPSLDRRVRSLAPDERFFYPLGGDRALHLHRGSLWGYDPVMLRRYAELIAATQPGDLDALGLTERHPSVFHPLFALLRCRTYMDNLTRVLGHPDPMPRFALLRQVRVIPEAEARLKTLVDPGFDWRRQVILEAPPVPAPAADGDASGDRIEVLGQSTDHVDLAITLASPAVLLVTDAYSDGWRARPLRPGPQPAYDLVPADHALQAVALAAGHHVLRLEFAPLSFRAGVVASVGGWLALGAAGLVAWRRRAPARAAAAEPERAASGPLHPAPPID